MENVPFIDDLPIKNCWYSISQTVSHYQRVYQFIDAFPTQNCANSNRASSFGGRASTTMKLSRPYLRQQDLCEDQFGLGRKLQVSIGSLDDNWSPRNPNCFFINGLTPWCRRPPFWGPWLSDVMRCYPTCFHICHVLSMIFTRIPRRWQRAAAAGQRVCGDLGRQRQSGKGPQTGFVSWWAVLRARFETL